MNIHEKLAELGLQLPEPPKPGGNYVSVNIRGEIAYLAIQFPFKNGEVLYRGKLGSEISTEEGYKAMQLCALNVLAQINQYIGFDKVLGLNHFDAYYQAETDFDQAPAVVNGASDLFVQVLGDKGTHSRAIFGVAKLSRNFCVGLTATFTVI
ncbi:RidA family protein [Adhaeribacter swui]|uniref:RidA family protein n=1 Tax=Adhaeribacter swui TaxID=2086471 RepID=A0A7G7GBE2_9BACT|nr:RidA family protein [Adhaeribacter swui]QNF34476.1 RidA family protein [Adhaeribacter swui]